MPTKKPRKKTRPQSRVRLTAEGADVRGPAAYIVATALALVVLLAAPVVRAAVLDALGKIVTITVGAAAVAVSLAATVFILRDRRRQ